MTAPDDEINDSWEEKWMFVHIFAQNEKETKEYHVM